MIDFETVDTHSAFPCNADKHTWGLTKREYFAAMAMQSVEARTAFPDHAWIANHAVELADALIDALNRPKEEQ